MSKKSKKGYALAIVIMFAIILIASGLGLYYFVEYHAREIKVQEPGYIKGHYAAIAGLRYAAILLKNPGNIFTTPNDPDDGESYTVQGDELGGDFFADIGVLAANLTITIDEIPMGEPHEGEYAISATYRYRY